VSQGRLLLAGRVQVVTQQLGDDEEMLLVVEVVVHPHDVLGVCVPRGVEVLEQPDLIKALSTWRYGVIHCGTSRYIAVHCDTL